MSEENKQRLKEYRKITVKQKNQHKIDFFFIIDQVDIKKPYGNKGVFNINNVGITPLYISLPKKNAFVKSFW